MCFLTWTHQLFCVDSISAKLVPLAYGIKKLQISCVVEDDKVCGGGMCVYTHVHPRLLLAVNMGFYFC